MVGQSRVSPAPGRCRRRGTRWGDAAWRRPSPPRRQGALTRGGSGRPLSHPRHPRCLVTERVLPLPAGLTGSGGRGGSSWGCGPGVRPRGRQRRAGARELPCVGPVPRGVGASSCPAAPAGGLAAACQAVRYFSEGREALYLLEGKKWGF